MPLYDTITVSEQQVLAIWKIDESVDELRSLLQISEGDQQRLNTFKLDRRKKEWLAARLLLQNLLGEYPDIIYGSNGKPRLAEDHRYISISHTTNYAAVSISDKPTALDIEIVSARVSKVANRFMHESEWPYIDAAHQVQFLTVLWCAKETLYKHFDVYGVIFKEQFVVSPFRLGDKGTLQCAFNQEGTEQHLALSFLINDDFTLVYC